VTPAARLRPVAVAKEGSGAQLELVDERHEALKGPRAGLLAGSRIFSVAFGLRNACRLRRVSRLRSRWRVARIGSGV
jgi:hypothetical protein